MKDVFISIGSNLGNKVANCHLAINKIAQISHTRLIKISKLRETKALTVSQEKSPDYINGVIQVETDMKPSQFLIELNKIEAEIGRVRTGVKWEPRIIDLDILFWGEEIIDEPDLKIPHPELHKRMFVLEPLCDIAPTFVHPVLKINMREAYENLLRQCGHK